MLCAVLFALSATVPTPGPSQQPPQAITQDQETHKHYAQPPSAEGVPQASPVARENDPSPNHATYLADNAKDSETQDRVAGYAKWQMISGWAMIGVAIGTGVIVWRYTVQARRQADAMCASVQLSQRQFEAADRPWIAVAPKPGGPLSSGENCVFFWAELVLKNVGGSPAINVNCRAVLIPCPPKLGATLYTMRAIEQQRILETELTNEHVASTPGGLLIVPGEPLAGWMVPESQEKQVIAVELGMLPSPFELLLVGCVAYRSTTSQRICWTRFAYHVGAVGSGPNAQHAMRLPDRNDFFAKESVCFFPTWGANSAT